MSIYGNFLLILSLSSKAFLSLYFRNQVNKSPIFTLVCSSAQQHRICIASQRPCTKSKIRSREAFYSVSNINGGVFNQLKMMILIERVTLHRRFTMTLIRCNKYIIHTSDQELAIDTIPYMLRLSEFVLRLLQNIVLASIHHHLDIMDVR